VIDLENPRKPTVLGKLKIPGFSTYLHPYDETTLIGLGRDTDENGRITSGVKLSLFDVADVNNPRELDKYVFEDRNSNSAALDDHKAFLFSKRKNLLVVPINSEEVIFDIVESEEALPKTMMRNYKRFNGAAVFSIDKYRFNLRGKIEHGHNHNLDVKRSLYIEEMLYTFSERYLKMNKLDNLEEINVLDLSPI